MMKDTPEFRLFYEVGYDSHTMMVIREPVTFNGIPSEGEIEVLVPTWKKVKRYGSCEPAFRFPVGHGNGALQSLFNNMWEMGFRPKDGTGNGGPSLRLMTKEGRDHMTNRFNKDMPEWRGTYGKRLQDCVALLYINGYLSGAEKDRVRKRIEKAWLKESLRPTTGIEDGEAK